MKFHLVVHPCLSVSPGLKLGASCGLSIVNTVPVLPICIMGFMQNVRYPCHSLEPSSLRDVPETWDAARQILRAHARIRPWLDLRDTKPYLVSSNKPAVHFMQWPNGTCALRSLLPLRLISVSCCLFAYISALREIFSATTGCEKSLDPSATRKRLLLPSYHDHSNLPSH